ncbi:hypothetical protein [Sphingomonas colocasiae]|uniref:XRE family transcriptional regulator n=1 Tax=Sphingomonas colocasiae TaxID=1848973 RepID=A0ABS7PR33_9SPHN|nr:hypothetical protein [Sphingomonas colocasiae]MBY8823444.1 hypothetical protein [Sphingomonas colocasiae]
MRRPEPDRKITRHASFPHHSAASIGAAIVSGFLSGPGITIHTFAKASGIAAERWQALIEGEALVDQDMAAALGAITGLDPQLILEAQDDFIPAKPRSC